ncbi:Hypothetical protein D9617_9g026050 [Elsinoe fawcettii]|nr:Hypothetical protein D9617_9g026050 [Elsinoe fawcettii]
MADIYPELVWHQVAPHRWERGIDEVEEFYYAISRAYEGTGRRFFAMTGFVAFQVKHTSLAEKDLDDRINKAVEQAWLQLRFRHPTLASWVAYDPARKTLRKIYEDCTDRQSQLTWLSETVKRETITCPPLHWLNSDPPAPSLPTLFVLRAQSSGERSNEATRALVIRSPHEIIDGIGTLQLFDDLFALAAEAFDKNDSWSCPDFGTEHKSLSPPLRLAARIPRDLTPEQSQRWDEMMTRNQTLRSNVNLSVLPYRESASLPGVHKRVALRFPIERTRELVAACKAVGATVTHAIHAAITLALRDLQPRLADQQTVRYLGYTLINYRRFCDWPNGAQDHPVSAIHSSSGVGFVVDLPVPPINSAGPGPLEVREEFQEALKITRDYYISIRDDPDKLAWAPRLMGLGIPVLSADTLKGQTPAVPAPDRNPSVTLSSMGRTDDIVSHRYGPFELDDPWVTGEELRTSLGTFLGTWKGCLTFSATYNDAWHNETEVMDFLRSCEDIIFTGFGIAPGTQIN